MSHGRLFEKPEFFRDVPGCFTVAAYDPVGRHGGDEEDIHDLR
jgi:hypothetical protein